MLSIPFMTTKAKLAQNSSTAVMPSFTSPLGGILSKVGLMPSGPDHSAPMSGQTGLPVLSMNPASWGISASQVALMRSLTTANLQIPTNTMPTPGNLRTMVQTFLNSPTSQARNIFATIFRPWTNNAADGPMRGGYG